MSHVVIHDSRDQKFKCLSTIRNVLWKKSPLLFVYPPIFLFCSQITVVLGFSLNGELSLNSSNSENLRNHWGMNWVQYKDLLCCPCLCGWVVESLTLTPKILGSIPAIFLFNFCCHWIENIQSNLHCGCWDTFVKLNEMCTKCFLKTFLFPVVDRHYSSDWIDTDAWSPQNKKINLNVWNIL